MLHLFSLFRDEKEFLSRFLPLHKNKMQEQGVQDVMNVKRQSSNSIETLINNQDYHSQIKNDETPEVDYPVETDSRVRNK